MKAASILSNVRDTISKGEHRANLKIICTFDESSLTYCCKLMKPLGVFERRLREIMYLIIVKAFGIDWVEKSFTESFTDELNDVIIGKINQMNKVDRRYAKNKISELAFEIFEYKEIDQFLFNKRNWECSFDEIAENQLSTEQLQAMSKDEIVQIISKCRKEVTVKQSPFKRKAKTSLRHSEVKITY